MGSSERGTSVIDGCRGERIEACQHGGGSDPQQHDVVDAVRQEFDGHIDRPMPLPDQHIAGDDRDLVRGIASWRSSSQATPSSCGRRCGSPHHTAPISHDGCSAPIASASGSGRWVPCGTTSTAATRPVIAVAPEIDRARTSGVSLSGVFRGTRPPPFRERRTSAPRGDCARRDRPAACGVAATTRRGSPAGRRSAGRRQPPRPSSARCSVEAPGTGRSRRVNRAWLR